MIQEKENGRRRGEGQGALQGAGQEQKLHASCQEGERASAQKLWTPAYNTVYPPTEAVLSGQDWICPAMPLGTVLNLSSWASRSWLAVICPRWAWIISKTPFQF